MVVRLLGCIYIYTICVHPKSAPGPSLQKHSGVVVYPFTASDDFWSFPRCADVRLARLARESPESGRTDARRQVDVAADALFPQYQSKILGPVRTWETRSEELLSGCEEIFYLVSVL